MEHREPPALNLEALQDNTSGSYEASQSASSSSRYDPVRELTEEYERKLAAYELEKQRLVEEKDDALARAQKERAALQERNTEIENLNQDISSLTAQLEDLRKEARNTQKAHEVELRRVKDDLTEMTEYRERYTTISKQLDRYRAKIDEMGHQQTQIEALQAELDEKTREIVNLEKTQEELADAKRQIEDLKASVAQTTADLITAQTSRAVVDKELLDVKQRLQQVDREKSALELQLSVQAGGQRVSDANRGMNYGGENVRDLKAQILRLEEQVKSLQEASGQDMAKSVLELKQQLDVAERTKAILQTKLEEALARPSSTGQLDASIKAGESEEDMKALLDQERAKQVTMHEVYSRVIHRLALRLKEQSILMKNHPQNVGPR